MTKISPSNHFDRTTTFKDEIFDNYFKEVDKELDTEIKFHNCTFKMPLILDGIKSSKLYFFQCTFEAYSVIENSNFNVLDFLGCKFNGDKLNLKRNSSNIFQI